MATHLKMAGDSALVCSRQILAPSHAALPTWYAYKRSLGVSSLKASVHSSWATLPSTVTTWCFKPGSMAKWV
jgi:hypothetical protein